MAEPCDPPDTDEAEGPALAPRAPRHHVLLSAVVERFGGTPPTRHRVRDLSTGGVRLDQAATLRVGATVLVTVGALQSVGATVVWVKDGLAGLKFAEPIEPEEARAKTMIAPSRAAKPPLESPAIAPRAGWIGDLRDAYRK
jgi:hypothetical protein